MNNCLPGFEGRRFSQLVNGGFEITLQVVRVGKMVLDNHVAPINLCGGFEFFARSCGIAADTARYPPVLRRPAESRVELDGQLNLLDGRVEVPIEEFD